MSFVTSPLLWGPLLALLPLIVVMYLLKLKRKRVQVPSTLLWRRSVQDLIANAPFQKLRNNLLMWLQLLALLLLILAFARPTMFMRDLGGSTLILLVDNSASMQTKEAARTRLDLAKDKALEAINGLSSKDEAIVITFSDQMNIVQTMSSDKTALRDAIRAIQPRDVDTSLKEAGLYLLGLTTSVNPEGFRTPRPNTHTIIFSDGAINDLGGVSDVPNVEYVAVGETDNNLGISSVDVRDSFSETADHQIFVSVTNASDVEKEAFVEFEAGGEILDLKSAMVPPRGTSGIVFTTSEEIAGLATLRLQGEDALPLDNLVRVQVSPPREVNVLIVTAGNYFLEQVFSVDPRLKVSVVRPSEYIPGEEYDIVVFDSCDVGELPSGRFVFINAIPASLGYEKGTEVENPRIIDWNRVHPLTRFANFEQVLIGKSIGFKAPRSAITIVEAVETDLISLYETEQQKAIVIGFDIFKSYWPLDVSFPIFMSNLIAYYSSNDQGTERPSWATGQTIAIQPPRDVSAATMTSPGGGKREFTFAGINTAFFTETAKAGVYTLAYDNKTELHLPVNLLSESESLITPSEKLELGGEKVISANENVKVNQEIWPWLVLGVLAVLLLEWLIYCKRTFM